MQSWVHKSVSYTVYKGSATADTTSIPRNNIHLKIYIQLQHLVAMQEVVCDLHSEANSVGLEMWPYL